MIKDSFKKRLFLGVTGILLWIGGMIWGLNSISYGLTSGDYLGSLLRLLPVVITLSIYMFVCEITLPKEGDK